jgi:hypothetical protein
LAKAVAELENHLAALNLSSEVRAQLEATLHPGIALSHGCDQHTIVDTSLPPAKEHTFATHGLPTLGEKQGSDSGASENNGHELAVLKASKALLVPRDTTLKEIRPSALWGLHAAGSMASYGSESDVQQKVSAALSEAIAASGLRGVLHCFNELSVFRLRADIWVVQRRGIPVGVVEVKKPHPVVMTSKRVHGQIYDYMLRLRTQHGIQHVFGIVTTYKEWRFFWFPESDGYAASDEPLVADAAPYADPVDEATTTNANDNRSEDAEVQDDEAGGDAGGDDGGEEDAGNEGSDEDDEDDDEEQPLIGEIEKIGNETRVLHGSRVYESNDKQLPMVLAGVIRKMHHSPRAHVDLLDPKVDRICMNSDHWYWGRLSGVEDIDDTRMPRRDAADFVMLQDFRGGADGRVWRACTLSGIGCIIKFAHKKDENDTPADQRKRLEREALVWHGAWQEKNTRVCRVGGDWALIMPYARPIPDLGNIDEDTKKETSNAIKQMAKRGYCHDDLHWRHVGRVKRKATEKIVFFDLTRVSSVRSRLAAREAAVNKMHKSLGLKLNAP